MFQGGVGILSNVYEYKIVHYKKVEKLDDLSMAWNTLGQDGWQMVGFHVSGDKVDCVFKKEKVSICF
jgi:hypothetical protein